MLSAAVLVPLLICKDRTSRMVETRGRRGGRSLEASGSGRGGRSGEQIHVEFWRITARMVAEEGNASRDSIKSP